MLGEDAVPPKITRPFKYGLGTSSGTTMSCSFLHITFPRYRLRWHGIGLSYVSKGGILSSGSVNTTASLPAVLIHNDQVRPGRGIAEHKALGRASIETALYVL